MAGRRRVTQKCVFGSGEGGDDEEARAATVGNCASHEFVSITDKIND
jgi:hypothetical protein